MNTTRTKRWNGHLDSLSRDYLKEVQQKMESYGDRVQFSLVSGGGEPSYQVINAVGKKMAFDRNHHLLQAEEADFAGANATGTLSMDQIKSAISGVGLGAASTSRSVRVTRASPGTKRTSAAKANELFAVERYEYFKNNRQSLPPTITEHSEEITQLMQNGKSAADAFSEVVSKYYS
ncbi:hypothetical protein [Noviherbaspirillum saxi]|uniref:Uncharacterized protein n=1 Tax=Noviherbaspirillum saxi TaxID=2320863 RepID=A0A3A3FN07_9BURK|nr:hypothetical protein [Noviherbaspirillum saxi]RJF95039.1 hypothetical protein D3871_16360 [Noviherbaspirillum saxi]